MRKVFLLGIAIVLLYSNLFAEGESSSQNLDVPSKKNFIGFGTGINSDTGIFGAIVNIGMSEKSMIGFGAGIGAWGFKTGVNLQFHPKGYYKHFFKVGVSMASGISEISLPMETVEYGDDDVSMKFNPVYNANLTFGYNFKLGRAARLFLEGGFALNLTDNAYEVLDDVELSSDSKAAMDFQTPGGFRLAIGIDFGI